MIAMTFAAFEAMADPTRRHLLERLRRDGPLSLSQLTDGLPMTRQAVAKHLERLREAGLLRIERRGRERIHELDPDPVRLAALRMRPYAAAWDQRLTRLTAHLEDNP